MSFSTSKLMTEGECAVLTTHGHAEARTADYKIGVATHSQENMSLMSAEHTDELVGLNDEITSVTSRLPGMTVGAFKIRKENELRKAIDRRDELVARQQTEGAVALIKRELELANAQDELARANQMIADVAARLVEIRAGN